MKKCSKCQREFPKIEDQTIIGLDVKLEDGAIRDGYPLEISICYDCLFEVLGIAKSEAVNPPPAK
jgi:hypothetical protein